MNWTSFDGCQSRTCGSSLIGTLTIRSIFGGSGKSFNPISQSINFYETLPNELLRQYKIIFKIYSTLWKQNWRTCRIYLKISKTCLSYNGFLKWYRFVFHSNIHIHGILWLTQICVCHYLFNANLLHASACVFSIFIWLDCTVYVLVTKSRIYELFGKLSRVMYAKKWPTAPFTIIGQWLDLLSTNQLDCKPFPVINGVLPFCRIPYR